ncbi:hypothetical protein OIU34_00385 [Pararhizobium sp. BT-229]|uniref:helix-turn-helix domain-containing protein n=1 Tax=Pararhizobium sp. BT-229 TaxID=2986923 RepID=UPI0021F75A3C|nr:hypothetical protein [Pararhizobium sp. BT-229]MCV9960343.1 hypothetical protein [Pararhizobium sp. BT-229]
MILIQPSIARAARAYTRLSQGELGGLAGLASRTIVKAEKDGKITQESLDKILAALGRRGVVMLYDDHGSIRGMEFHPKKEGP